MRRGEIWWASLPAPTGSGQGYRRPVIIIQANDFNESRIRTVIVVALTANVKLAGAPGNVLCRRKDTRLFKDSVANVSQVMTIDKSLLTEKISTLPSLVMKRVEEGLRLVLAL